MAIDTSVEELYTRFQNHYFAQVHRYYHARTHPDTDLGQTTLPYAYLRGSVTFGAAR